MVPVARDAASARESKVALDGRFLQQLRTLLRICVPGVLTPEFGYAALVAVLMVRLDARLSSRWAREVGRAFFL